MTVVDSGADNERWLVIFRPEGGGGVGAEGGARKDAKGEGYAQIMVVCNKDSEFGGSFDLLELSVGGSQ